MFITEGTEFYYANRNTKTAEKCVAVMVRNVLPILAVLTTLKMLIKTHKYRKIDTSIKQIN